MVKPERRATSPMVISLAGPLTLLAGDRDAALTSLVMTVGMRRTPEAHVKVSP